MEPLTIFLFITALIIVAYIFYKIGSLATNLKWQKRIPQLQRLTAEKQRAGIKGKLAEAFAPFLPGFPFKPSECKFIGDPIDYLVFEGLDERDVKSIHFVEVKQGTSKLSKHQKQIKEIIDKKEDISFEEFRFENQEE